MIATLGPDLFFYPSENGKPAHVEAHRETCPEYAEVLEGARRLGLSLTLSPWARFDRQVGFVTEKWTTAWRCEVVSTWTPKRRAV
jgi:hypothetical protein